MSTTTSNLGLFKYNTATDGDTPFNIDTALNNNWDTLDANCVRRLSTTSATGSSSNPVYVDSMGQIQPASTTIGSSSQPVYLNSGTITACSNILSATTSLAENGYIKFSNGVLQQWGTIQLTEEERVWEQPVLTANGQAGDEVWCWCSHSTNNPPYKALDGDRTSSMITHEGQLTSGYTYFYFEILPNINISSLQFVQAAGINTVTCTVEATPQFSDNGYTTLGTFSYSGVQNSISTFTFSEAQKNTNYHRFRITIPANHKPYHVYAYLGEVIINATYKVEASNTITFPLSYSNTLYAHSLGMLDGTGINSYVSNKTTSGMHVSNGSTSANRASWITIGF